MKPGNRWEVRTQKGANSSRRVFFWQIRGSNYLRASSVIEGAFSLFVILEGHFMGR